MRKGSSFIEDSRGFRFDNLVTMSRVGSIAVCCLGSGNFTVGCSSEPDRRAMSAGLIGRGTMYQALAYMG